MNSDDIRILIENSIEDSVALVSSDDNVHFEAVVISPAFREHQEKSPSHILHCSPAH